MELKFLIKMTKNNDVIDEFVKIGFHNDIKTKNVFIEKNAVFSYGYHFPMCLKVFDSNGEVIFILNKDRYSRSTSKHQNYLRAIIGQYNKVYFMTTTKLKDLIEKNITNFSDIILNDLEQD